MWRIYSHHAGDPGWIAHRHSPNDKAAPIMAYKNCFFYPAMVKQSFQITREMVKVISFNLCWPLRLPVPSLIRCKHVKSGIG